MKGTPPLCSGALRAERSGRIRRRQAAMRDWFWQNGLGLYVGQAMTYVWDLQHPEREWRFQTFAWAYEVMTKKLERAKK